MSDDDWESEVEEETWTVPKVEVKPDSPKSAPKAAPSPVKEKLLTDSPKKSPAKLPQTEKPKVTDCLDAKTNALREFQIKTMPDIDILVNTLIRSKLFPKTDDRKKKVKTKAAAWKMVKGAMEQKMGQLEPKELDKLEREIAKQVEFKKVLAANEEAEKKKDLLAAEEAKKKQKEEELKKEAEAKGESYVNDEDFFAGLE